MAPKSSSPSAPSASPPRSVMKALLKYDKIFNFLEPPQLRELKSLHVVVINIVKFADDSSLQLGLGLSASNATEAKLGHILWQKEFNDWGVEEWSWFYCTILNYTSGILPPPREVRYYLRFHYKLHPVDALAFGEKVVERLKQIIVLPRFSEDPSSLWYHASASSLDEGIEFQPASVDLASDSALVFDTQFHWRRAGELLGASIKDLSLSPAVTFNVGSGTKEMILASDGSGWHKSPMEYIMHRISGAASGLPEEEKRDIASMFVHLATAEKDLKDISTGEYCRRALDALEKNKRGAVPKALRAGAM